MKVTILGCGTSTGVPLIGNDWGKCDPAQPRNRRTRASILVEQGETVLLIDTSPDMRQQLLAADARRIDAVLYTHPHADHCHGIDDLRTVNWMMHRPIDIYGDEATLSNLVSRFPYIFTAEPDNGVNNHFYKPAVATHVIDGDFTVGGIAVRSVDQDHGFSRSRGFRFGDFAYSTDLHALDEAGFAFLSGVKTWVVDCVRYDPHPTHSHLEQTLAWIERVRPERAYLTHMNHSMDYETLMKSLPAGVEPAYDGMVIAC